MNVKISVKFQICNSTMLTPDTVYPLNQRFLTFRLPRTSFKKFLVVVCVFKKSINCLSSNLESTFYSNNTITTRVYDYFVAWRGFAGHRLRTAASNYFVASGYSTKLLNVFVRASRIVKSEVKNGTRSSVKLTRRAV